MIFLAFHLTHNCPFNTGLTFFCKFLRQINPKKAQKKKNDGASGTLILTEASSVPLHAFVDWLHAGLQIGVVSAVDFTASNGNPQFSNSLHHLSPYAPNQYLQAIFGVGAVLEPYDADKMFPMFGKIGFEKNGFLEFCLMKIFDLFALFNLYYEICLIYMVMKTFV